MRAASPSTPPSLSDDRVGRRAPSRVAAQRPYRQAHERMERWNR
jgi:hypothetical protein